jgi:hypothetical protein
MGFLLSEAVWDPLSGADIVGERTAGIKATIVNSEVLMRNNEHTGVLPGKLLRGPLARSA